MTHAALPSVFRVRRRPGQLLFLVQCFRLMAVALSSEDLPRGGVGRAAPRLASADSEMISASVFNEMVDLCSFSDDEGGTPVPVAEPKMKFLALIGGDSEQPPVKLKSVSKTIERRPPTKRNSIQVSSQSTGNLSGSQLGGSGLGNTAPQAALGGSQSSEGPSANSVETADKVRSLPARSYGVGSFSLPRSAILDDYDPVSPRGASNSAASRAGSRESTGEFELPGGRELGYQGSSPMGLSGGSPLSDSAIAKMRKPFMVGKTRAGDILIAGGYLVDTSGWVNRLVRNGARLSIFLRPRGFGKSTSLSFAELYFNHEAHAGRVASGLVMMQHRAQKSEHHGKYSVLTVSFRQPSIMNASTAAEFVEGLVSYLGLLVQQLLWRYRKSEFYVPYEQSRSNKFLNHATPSKRLSDWTGVLAMLIEMAHSFSGLRAVVLIDDYDAVLLKAYRVGALESVQEFFVSFYAKALAMAKTEKLFKMCAFGVQRFKGAYPFRGLSPSDYRYYSLGDEPFQQDFGFTQGDVDEIHKAYARSVSTIHLAGAFGGFNGGAGTKNPPLFHPLGVAKAFKHERINKSYVLGSQPIGLYWLPFKYMQGYALADLSRLLRSGEQPKTEPCLNHLDLLGSASPPGQHEFLSYLRLEGYLGFQGKTIVPVNSAVPDHLMAELYYVFELHYEMETAWRNLGKLKLAEFYARLARPWLTAGLLARDPPMLGSDADMFIEFVGRSAERWGNPVAGFQPALQSQLTAVEAECSLMYRFTPDDQDHILLALIYTPVALVDPARLECVMAQAVKASVAHYAASQAKEQEKRGHVAEYPNLSSVVVMVFSQMKTNPILAMQKLEPSRTGDGYRFA